MRESVIWRQGAKWNRIRKVRPERDAHFSDQSRGHSFGQTLGIESEGSPV